MFLDRLFAPPDAGASWQSWLLPVVLVLAMTLGGFLLDLVLGGGRKRSPVDEGKKLWSHMVYQGRRHVFLPFMILAGLVLALLAGGWTDPLALGLRRTLELSITVYVTYLVARIGAGWLQERQSQDHQAPMASHAILVSLLHAVVYSLGGLLVMSQLDIDIAPVLTALGVGGLAVALALQSTLSNFFTGLQLLASRRIRVGDFVRLETGIEGTVVSVDWRSTIIHQGNNQMVVVPNQKLADAVVTNTTLAGQSLSLVVPVTVAYGSDLDRVEEACLTVARQVLATVPGADPAFDPVVRFNTLGDSAIGLAVVLRTMTWPDTHLVRHEFIKRLLGEFALRGIRVPYPQVVVHRAREEGV